MADPRNHKGFQCGLALFALLLTQSAFGDNQAQHNGVDKIYHPYVNALEKEFEYRVLYQNDGIPAEDDILRHRIGYGQAVNDRVFLELNILNINPPDGSSRLEAYELEARMQLTEQGEYWADWGIVFELERQRSDAVTELASTLLIEKEFGSWTATANLTSEFEFGSDIDDELDTELALQARYRLSEHFEPAVEFYQDEFTSALGPVVQGLERVGINRKLHWELGVLFPLNHTTPDTTYRFLLEYEF